MLRISNLKDIVDWNLCIGCGACYYHCEKQAIVMKNIETVGIRPVIDSEKCADCSENCLSFCPGFRVEGRVDDNHDPCSNHAYIIGPTRKIWEGYAADTAIRYSASSGGALTALALYCLEKKGMDCVVHTGMDDKVPWLNKTVISRTKDDLLKNTGSRYQTSSPCELLGVIEKSEKPCVFIGRPCDVAAVSEMRKIKPGLDEKLGLVLTFFCAGTPSTRATIDLVKKFDIDISEISKLRYRGNGWPGGFTISRENREDIFMSYNESWGFLNGFRSFRCHYCPDGLGEIADISCGDAWHRYLEGNNDPGRSLVLARNSYGEKIVREAVEEGYLQLTESSSEDVLAAQGLIERRKVVFGRQLAMKMLLIPTTKLNNYYLFKNWSTLPVKDKIISIIGTARRLLQRGLWHRNSVQ